MKIGDWYTPLNWVSGIKCDTAQGLPFSTRETESDHSLGVEMPSKVGHLLIEISSSFTHLLDRGSAQTYQGRHIPTGQQYQTVRSRLPLEVDRCYVNSFSSSQMVMPGFAVDSSITPRQLLIPQTQRASRQFDSPSDPHQIRLDPELPLIPHAHVRKAEIHPCSSIGIDHLCW